MRATILLLFINIAFTLSGQENTNYENQRMTENKKEFKKLTEIEEFIIINKGTEFPFTGEFNEHKKKGIYACKQCNNPLYYSSDKFESNCGWPSFDDEIKGAVTKSPIDVEGQMEITCSNCDGHLGHVFYGENFTSKNTRHCVNSVSLNFIPRKSIKKGGH